MAQLAERSLPTPEIRGSNPAIGNISNIFICQLLSRKDENKEKEARKGPFKRKSIADQVYLDVVGLSGIVDHLEGVRAVAVHVPAAKMKVKNN